MPSQKNDILERLDDGIQEMLQSDPRFVSPEVKQIYIDSRQEILNLRETKTDLWRALKELKGVIVEVLLPICRKHGGTSLWVAEEVRLTNAFQNAEEAIHRGQ